MPGAATVFVDGGQASALQIPANIVDHRHVRSGVLADSITKNVAIFVRSVYLQGLLAMAEETIPNKLQGIVPERRRLASVAAASGLSLTELALRYLLSLPGITSILTGVETREQVEQNLEMFSKGKLSEDIMAAIHQDTVELPELLITPSMWST
jgi:aryl-alcohol dehydrogenase-like predicted oxidoreductase